MARRADTRFSRLVARHSPYASTTDLGHAIGEPTLAQRVRRARQRHALPDSDLLFRIADELDEVGRALLVDALAWDACLPGYEPGEASDLSRRLSRVIRSLTVDQRRALLQFLTMPGGDWSTVDATVDVIWPDDEDEPPIEVRLVGEAQRGPSPAVAG